MVELPFRILPNLKNYRVQAVAYPADGAMLNRKVRPLVGVIRMEENRLRFLEADSAPRVPPETFALPLVGVKSH